MNHDETELPPGQFRNDPETGNAHFKAFEGGAQSALDRLKKLIPNPNPHGLSDAELAPSFLDKSQPPPQPSPAEIAQAIADNAPKAAAFLREELFGCIAERERLLDSYTGLLQGLDDTQKIYSEGIAKIRQVAIESIDRAFRDGMIIGAILGVMMGGGVVGLLMWLWR